MRLASQKYTLLSHLEKVSDGGQLSRFPAPARRIISGACRVLPAYLNYLRQPNC